VTHFKLGLLAIAFVVALVATAIGLGLRIQREPAVDFHTLIDESVQGLEIGAAVKYRGVEIGDVTNIAIAPDDRLVDVTMTIHADQAVRVTRAMNHGLRAELSSMGITGVKFIDLSYGDGRSPTLAFLPPPRYVPSRPSLLARLEGETQRIRTLLDSGTRVLDDFDQLATDLRREDVPAKLAAALVDVRRLARDANANIGQVRARFATSLDAADRAIATLARLGQRGLPAAGELARTLRDLGDTARSVRDLVKDIERQPDILIKGRARPKGL
jgi:phospholipid/cholesterol/gamma-HCH transport system substrate-binding protein